MGSAWTAARERRLRRERESTGCAVGVRLRTHGSPACGTSTVVVRRTASWLALRFPRRSRGPRTSAASGRRRRRACRRRCPGPRGRRSRRRSGLPAPGARNERPPRRRPRCALRRQARSRRVTQPRRLPVNDQHLLGAALGGLPSTRGAGRRPTPTSVPHANAEPRRTPRPATASAAIARTSLAPLRADTPAGVDACVAHGVLVSFVSIESSSGRPAVAANDASALPQALTKRA
jgi:hypothetical protein